MRKQTLDTNQGRARCIFFLLVVSATHFILQVACSFKPVCLPAYAHVTCLPFIDARLCQGAPFKLPGVCAFTPRQSSGFSKSSTLLPNNFHAPGTAAGFHFEKFEKSAQHTHKHTNTSPIKVSTALPALQASTSCARECVGDVVGLARCLGISKSSHKTVRKMSSFWYQIY